MRRFGDWISIVLGGVVILAAPAAAHGQEKPNAAEILRKRLEGDVDSGKLQKGERLPPANLTKDQTIFATPNESSEKDKPSEGLTLLERMGQSLPDLPPAKPFTGKVDEAYGAFQRGLYLSALNIALPRAQLGDAASQTLVAELLNNGLGVRRNPADAAFWYEQAARAGDANAQYKYALMLLTGENVKQDKKAADAMMRKAAEGGSREAQFNVAQLLVAANPGEKGLQEALPFYEKAALQGVPGDAGDYFARFAAITHSSSNMIETPSHAVPPDGSKGGDTSTTSAPTMLTPSSPRTTCSAWKEFGPPTSGVPVPGAKAGESLPLRWSVPLVANVE